MKCIIKIAPVEGDESIEFQEPPQIKIKCEHPAYDYEVQDDVRQAFYEAVPIYEQTQFLNNYEYPYQYPHIATIDWTPDKSIVELAEDIELTDIFEY